MRSPVVPFLFVSMVGVGGCSREAVGTGAPPWAAESPAPTTQPVDCAPRDGALCRDLPRATPDEPSHDGAIAWANVGVLGIAPQLGASHPKTALYEDGTIRQTTEFRDLASSLLRPRGLIEAKLAPALLAKVRADVAAVRDEDMRAFFAPYDVVSPASYDVIDIGHGSACFHFRADSQSSCRPPALMQVRDDFVSMARAVELKFRAAETGTVWVGDELSVTGAWLLPEGRAVEGFAELSADEWASLGGEGIFRLRGGDYVEVRLSQAGRQAESVYVHITYMRTVALGDELAPLRDELLASVGGSLELGPDRFPLFKNRDVVVIVPAMGWTAARVRHVVALEHLDLRGDGDVTF